MAKTSTDIGETDGASIGGFLQMPNRLVDELLPWMKPREFVLLTYLLRRWNRTEPSRAVFASVRTIAKETGQNRKTVWLALAELRQRGLITSESRGSEAGKSAIVLTPLAYSQSQKTGLDSEIPIPENGSGPIPKNGRELLPENGSGIGPTPISTNQTKRTRRIEPTPQTPKGASAGNSHSSAADGFEAFWAAYPAKGRTGERRARKLWAGIIGQADQPETARALAAEIVAGVNRWAEQSAQWRRGYGQHAPRFLEDRMWEQAPDDDGFEDAEGEGWCPLCPSSCYRGERTCRTCRDSAERVAKWRFDSEITWEDEVVKAEQVERFMGQVVDAWLADLSQRSADIEACRAAGRM